MRFLQKKKTRVLLFFLRKKILCVVVQAFRGSINDMTIPSERAPLLSLSSSRSYPKESQMPAFRTHAGARAAARAITDAFQGRAPSPLSSFGEEALRSASLRAKLRYLTWFSTIILIVLVFWEPPYWCETSSHCKAKWISHPRKFYLT